MTLAFMAGACGCAVLRGACYALRQPVAGQLHRQARSAGHRLSLRSGSSGAASPRRPRVAESSSRNSHDVPVHRARGGRRGRRLRGRRRRLGALEADEEAAAHRGRGAALHRPRRGGGGRGGRGRRGRGRGRGAAGRGRLRRGGRAEGRDRAPPLRRPAAEGGGRAAAPAGGGAVRRRRGERTPLRGRRRGGVGALHVAPRRAEGPEALADALQARPREDARHPADAKVFGRDSRSSRC